jgi:ribosomal protein L11 methyltransferase
MRWLELTVEAHVEAVEAVSEIFGRLGRGAAVRPTRLITEPGDELAVREDPDAPYLVTAHLPDDPDAPVAIETTERALWHLQAFGLGPVGKLRVARVDDGDWAEAWKSGYAPQRIGRIAIVPSWQDEPMAPGELTVRLDPGMAFGTGLHPTTRGCLMLLQRLEPMPARVLDVGTGSGILGLAALRLGAEQVLALDTDPVAVDAACRVSQRGGKWTGGSLRGQTGNDHACGH